MPILFNAPKELSDVRSLSAQAGQDVTAALGLLMWSFHSVEGGFYDSVAKNLGTAAVHFRTASRVFNALMDKVPTEKIVISSPPLREAWETARRFTTVASIIVDRQLPLLPPRSDPFAASLLMKFARDLTESLAAAIERTQPHYENEAAMRRIAIQATIVQITGTLVAEVWEEAANTQIAA